MKQPTIIFFGSFQDYSLKVLEALHRAKHIKLLAVVTTPPSPNHGRTPGGPNPVHLYAKTNGLPVFTPIKLTQQTLRSTIYDLRSDFFVVAGFGKILPQPWLEYPHLAPLNLHFSLLPRFRGANPAEWAILAGDKQTGVSLIVMTNRLDAGPILTQEKIAILPTDTRVTLYDKLYTLAGDVIVKYLRSTTYDLKSAQPQPRLSPTPPAIRLTKADAFVPWDFFTRAMAGQDVPASERSEILLADPTAHISIMLERATRALSGYPYLWTKIKTLKGEKRLKILSTAIKNSQLSIVNCQLEGYSPSSFNQLKNQILA